MSEIEDYELRRGGTTSTVALPNPANRPARWPPQVSFSRHELNQILSVYGRKVSAGDWRDYAIDLGKEKAVFSIFRRSSEVPLYRIEKNPRLSRKQGAFSVITQTGMILKRGHELANVLRVLDKRLRIVKS